MFIRAPDAGRAAAAARRRPLTDWACGTLEPTGYRTGVRAIAFAALAAPLARELEKERGRARPEPLCKFLREKSTLLLFHAAENHTIRHCTDRDCTYTEL